MKSCKENGFFIPALFLSLYLGLCLLVALEISGENTTRTGVVTKLSLESNSTYVAVDLRTGGDRDIEVSDANSLEPGSRVVVKGHVGNFTGQFYVDSIDVTEKTPPSKGQ